MIGFYDYTVILTYISLASSILGMISACYARIGWAIFFLGMSGLLDTFDGKVARTKKNRSALVFRSTRFVILSALASAL